MRKSISQWAFTLDKSVEECMALAREASYEGLEVVLEDDPSGERTAQGVLTLQALEQQAEKVVEKARAADLGISSVATGLLWDRSLSADDDQERAEAMAITRALLKAANLVGVDAVLVIPGVVDAPFAKQEPPVPYEVCYSRVQQAVEELLPEAEELGVRMGLEPVWNMCFLSPLEWVQFIDGLGSPWVGVYFDVGNVVNTGYPEQWIRLLGSRIARVHFKDFKRAVGTLDGFCDLLEGDVDWFAVMAALREVGYDNWVTAEVFPGNPAGTEHLLYSTSRAMDHIFRL